MTRLYLREVATDLAEAATWHDRRRPGLGDELLAAVDESLARIEAFPFAYPIIFRDVRRALLRRFPYAVYFVIQRETLLILAVQHHARHPRSYRARRSMP